MLKLAYDGNGYDGQMDPECISICNALNSLPEIKTTSSCCGHGEDPFCVFFTAWGWRGLSFLGRCINYSYWQYGFDWDVLLSSTDIKEAGANFLLQSTCRGEEAYSQAEDLVRNMNGHLNLDQYIQDLAQGLYGFVVRDSEEDPTGEILLA